MKSKIFTLLAAIILASGISYGNQGGYRVDHPQVDSLIHAFMNKWGIHGGAFTMAFERTILYSKGYGVQDTITHTPATDESLFRIASCTKPFTAVSVMQLVQHGLLSLTDTVFGPNGILNQPEYLTILDNNVLKITVQDLLEHAGGWDSDLQIDPMFYAVEIAQWANVPSPPDQETIIQYVLQEMFLMHPPGTYYAYSNFGYCVLGRVIEKVTNMTYEDYVRQHVLIPSGITTMQLGKNLLANKLPGEVEYYGSPGEYTAPSVYDTTQTQIVPWPYGGFNIEAMDSHGQWVASSKDLMKFLMAVSENRLISQHIFNVMITPPSFNPTYAKGWGVNSAHNIWHMGSLAGTSSEIVKADNGYLWSLVFNKRSALDQEDLQNDLDNLGWSIIPYLPPGPADSCNISGPTVIPVNQVITYKSSLVAPDYSLVNYGSNASAVYFSNDTLKINSGSVPGYFTLNMLDAPGGNVLCSLRVHVDATLPVELESFSSAVNQNTVTLHWSTSSEENNSGFEIQRSSHGENWETKGFVRGAGNSGSPASYSFADVNVRTGRYLYRLKQIDFNGNFRYYELSNEVIIGTPEKFFLSQNYPNPFNPLTRIDYDLPTDGIVAIKLFDINGRQVSLLVNEFKSAGYYTFSFDASSLPSGTYFYRMETEKFSSVKKMILMK